jgi:hypothetical protein
MMMVAAAEREMKTNCRLRRAIDRPRPINGRVINRGRVNDGRRLHHDWEGLNIHRLLHHDLPGGNVLDCHRLLHHDWRGLHVNGRCRINGLRFERLGEKQPRADSGQDLARRRPLSVSGERTRDARSEDGRCAEGCDHFFHNNLFVIGLDGPIIVLFSDAELPWAEYLTRR